MILVILVIVGLVWLILHSRKQPKDEKANEVPEEVESVESSEDVYDEAKYKEVRGVLKDMQQSKAEHEAALYLEGKISKSNMCRGAKDIVGIDDRQFSEAQRAYIYDRDGGVCKICGVKVELSRYPLSSDGRSYDRRKSTLNPKAYEVDHIIPRRYGGLTEVANGQCTCHKCNNSKSKS